MAYQRINHSAVNETLDWHAIRNSSRSFKLEQLSAYSRCGVHPYTFGLVSALCSQFNLSTTVKTELAETWAKLSLKSTDSTRQILLDLASSDHGSAALGICGALNKSFEERSLGYVFSALAELSNLPDELKSSDESWFELARICTDVRLPSTFEFLVDKYARLGPTAARSAPVSLDGIQSPTLEHTGPRVVAEALQAMAALASRQQEMPLVIFGGSDAGWFAAVAEWMFDLKIQINAADGKSVFSNCEGQEHLLQLTLAFHNRLVPCEGDPVEDPPLRAKHEL